MIVPILRRVRLKNSSGTNRGILVPATSVGHSETNLELTAAINGALISVTASANSTGRGHIMDGTDLINVGPHDDGLRIGVAVIVRVVRSPGWLLRRWPFLRQHFTRVVG